MAIRGIRQFLINGEVVGVPEENVEQFLALTQDKGVEEAPASGTRYFMGDDGKTFAVNDEGARQMVQAARYGGFGVSRSMFKNAGLTEDYGSTANERLAFADQLGQFYPDEQVDGLGAPVKKNIGDAVMPAARFVGNVAAQTGKNLVFAPDSQWGEWLDEDGKSAGENVLKNAIRGANDYANKATQAAVSIPSNVNRLSSRFVEAGERAVGAEPTASEWMRRQSDIAEQRVANALPADTAERGNDFVDKAGEFVGNTLTTVGKFAVPGAAAVDISEGAAGTYYDTYNRALKAGHKATDAAILAATQSGIGATEGIILAKAAAGAKNAGGFLGNLKGMAASSAKVGALMGAAAGARDIFEQALDDPTGQVPYDPMQTAAETGKAFGEGAAFDAIAKGVHLLDRGPARQAALERTVAKNINDSRPRPTDNGVRGEGFVIDPVAPTVEPQAPASKPMAIQVPVKDGKGKVRMEPLLLPAPTAESMLPNPNQMAMRPGVMDVMKPQGEQGLLPPPVETRAQTNENAPTRAPADSKPIAPVEPTESRETPPATPTTPHGVNDGIRQFADAYSKGDRKGMAAAQKSLSEAWKVENDYLTLTPDEMGAITEKMPEAARGKFLEMANQWRETKETPPQEAAPTARSILPKDWKSAKVDEADADGKPLSEKDKMSLRQSQILTKIDEQQSRIASRERFDAVVNAFNEVETAQPFERDSIGAAHNTSVKRVANVIATSKFATPEEAERFKKYYEGEAKKPTTAAEFDPVEYKNWLAKQGKRDTNKMRNQFLATKRAAPTAEPPKPVVDEAKEAPAAKTKAIKPPEEAPVVVKAEPAPAEKPDGTAAYKRLSPSLRVLTPKQMRAKAGELEARNARPEVAADLRAAADQIEANGKLSAKAEPAVETPIAEKPTEKPAKPSKPVPETEAQFEARLAKEKAAAKDEGASEADIAEAERIQRLLRETGDEDARPLKDILYAKQGIDAKIEARRDDPEVVAWAKKQGRHIQNGKVDFDVVRGYDRDQATRAGKLVKNLFPDMEIEISPNPMELGGAGKSRPLPMIDGGGVQIDAEYMAAAGKGDVDTAQRIVNEAARNAGYATVAYHGTRDGGFNVFKPAEGNGLIWASESKDYARTFSEQFGAKKPKIYNVLLDIKNELDLTAIDNEAFIAEYKDAKNRWVPTKEMQKLADEIGIPVRKMLNFADKEMNREVDIDGEHLYSLIRSDKFAKWIQDKGFDGVKQIERGEIAHGFKSSSQIKSADPVTYDDNGKIILLSKRFNETSPDIRYLLSPSGETLGTFSPKTKKVILYPGANPATVAHEIGWHAIRDWAMRGTRAGNADAKKVYDKMREVEISAPDAIKDIVRKLYNGQTKSNIMNEFGAWAFMGRGGQEIKGAIKTRADQVWYAKAITAVKDAWKTFLTKTGWGNKVDFSGVENMTIDEFQDWLGKTLTSGKTIGKILPKTNEVRMDKASSLEKYLTATYDKNTPIKNIEKEIAKKTGVRIKAEDSPSAALQLKHGLDPASKISTDNLKNAYRKKLAETGLNNADVMNLMQYRAAEGRDAKIDAKNKAEIAKPFDLSINDMQTKRIDAAAKLAGVQAKLATARADLSAAQARNDSAAITDANRRIGQHTRWADYWKQTDTKLADDIAKATAKRDQKLAAYKTVNGSAVNLDEARKMIAERDNGPKAKEYHELEAMVREIIDATIEGRVKNGLLSRAEADKLKAEEPFYVPFKSPVDPTTGEYIGRGSLKDAEYRQAEGRQTSAGDIIGHILTDYENAMFRANENFPRQKLAALVRNNPELGTVTKLEADSKITERKTKDGSRIPDMGDPNVVLFKQNGDSYAIRLNGDRGAQVAAAFTGRNLSRIPGKVQGLARMWANTATSWVPTFITRNLLKDQPDVIFGLMGDYGLVKGGIMGAGYLGKQATGLSTVARFVTTGKIRTVKPNGKQDKIGAMFKEYVESGALIGGAASEGYGEIANAFSQKEIQKIAKEAQKGGKSVSKAAGQHLMKSIRYMNELAEISTRFNAYRTVREAGKTPTEAAQYSRDITVDFNRKGNITPLTNTLRMFSNSTLGGNVRNLAALSAKHGHKLALGLIVNGIAQAALEDFMNPDDDDEKLEKEGRGAGRDVSEYERKSALWLFRKGSNVSKYGMHAGPFSILSYFGSCLYRVARGQMEASTMAKELGLTTAEVAANLTPFTSGMNFDAQDGKIGTAAKSMVATLMPSLAQPFIEMGTGVDYAGRHYKQQGNYPGDTSPLSEKGRFTTSPLAKSAARWLNEETGGNEGRPGGIDMYPEDLQKLTTGILKGVGTDVMNAVDTGLAIFNGKWDELETRNVPFARDFKKNIEDNSGRYFETLHAMNVDVGDVNKRKTSAERREFAKTRPWMKYDGEKYALDEFAKEYVKDAEKWRKMAQGKVLKGRGWVEAETPPTREQVQAYKAKMRRAQAKLLEKYATGHVKSGD